MRDSLCFCGPFGLDDTVDVVAAPTDGSKLAVLEAAKEKGDALEAILESDDTAEERANDDEAAPAPKFPMTPKTIVAEAETRDEPDEASPTDSAPSKVAFADEVEFEADTAADEEPEEPEATPAGPVTNPPTDKTLHVELDFDVTPSELYLLLQRRDWEGSIDRAREFPEETTHWVSRKEADGKLRWRLLPVHGAIIFGAPDHVLKALLEVYPGSVAEKDDQGMLPLHLSYRMGSSEAVIDALLAAFPDSVDIKDAKGRTPLVMAQTTKSPNRAAFIKALERHAQATTVSSQQHTAALAKQRATFEAQIAEIRKHHIGEMKMSKAEQDRLSKEIERLKEELKESQSDCALTKSRVDLLENRLESKSVGETSVANKVTAMESCLKATIKAKEETEGRLTRENKTLLEENEEVTAKCSTLEQEISKLEAVLSEETKRLESEVMRLEIKLAGQSEKLKTLGEDHTSAKSYVAILEEQLKKKIAHENSLVEQVSSLARQLSVATQDNDSATSGYTERLRTIEKEREALRQTVSKLSRKLLEVAEYLGGVATEQAVIIQRVEDHEIDVLAAHEEHAKIAETVKTQQELFEQCRVEREHISQLLHWEHAALQQSADTRTGVLAAVEKHAQMVANTAKSRAGILHNATAMKVQLQAILNSVNDYIPAAVDQESSDFVDKVLETILSGNGNIFRDEEAVGPKAANREECPSFNDEDDTCETKEESPSALTEDNTPSDKTDDDPVSLCRNLDEIEASPSDEPAALSPKQRAPVGFSAVDVDVGKDDSVEVETTMEK